EYGFGRLNQVIRWAAGRESDVTITGATLAGDVLRVRVHNAGPAMSGRLTAQVRNRHWRARGAGQRSVEVPAGESTVEVTLDAVPESGPLAVERHLRNDAGQDLAFASAGVMGPDVAS